MRKRLRTLLGSVALSPRAQHCLVRWSLQPRKPAKMPKPRLQRCKPRWLRYRPKLQPTADHYRMLLRHQRRKVSWVRCSSEASKWRVACCEPGDVSVIASGLYSTYFGLPIIVRNASSQEVMDISVAATARDSADTLIAAGSILTTAAPIRVVPGSESLSARSTSAASSFSRCRVLVRGLEQAGRRLDREPAVPSGKPHCRRSFSRRRPDRRHDQQSSRRANSTWHLRVGALLRCEGKSLAKLSDFR